MRVAISQPEHFPYMGYFQKMCACDLFVILDDVQFSGPRSFQNRNRYINKAGNYEWFTVPVQKGSYSKLITDVLVSQDSSWRKKLSRKLLLDLHFDNSETIYSSEHLVDINMASINYCREIFNIPTKMIRSSELNVCGAKAEKIYSICKELGADTYVAGLGSYEYMKSADFRDIKVEYFHPIINDYQSSLVYATNVTQATLSLFQEIVHAPSAFCKEYLH